MKRGDENDDANAVFQTSGETALEVGSAALSAIPTFGGPLAAIADGVIRRRQNRRLNDFLVKLAEDLQQLRSQVNEKFMHSDKAKDLFEDIVTKAAETRQQAKLDALRATFLNTVLSDRPDYDEAAEIAALVDAFQERHLILLRILADPLRADREMGRPVGEGGGLATSINQILKRLLPDWGDEQIERTWQDLLDRQLHKTPGTKAMMTDKGIHQLEDRLTDFGRAVVEYITLPG